MAWRPRRHTLNAAPSAANMSIPPMSEPATTTDKPPVRSWPRVLLGFGLFVVLLCVLGIVGYQVSQSRVRSERALLEEKLDKDDPNWRLADLEKNRPEVPADQNSALLARRIADLVPPNWPPQALSDLLGKAQPPEQLTAEQAEQLEREMKLHSEAVTKARPLANMPYGRHPLHLEYNAMATILSSQQEIRRVASLLNYDAMLLAQQNDIDGALRSARATINAGRSLGDEPLIISQLIRMACVAIGCNGIERALSQGVASEAELTRVQALLALEEAHPTMRIAARGERAMAYDTINKILDGRITPSAVHGGPPGSGSWWEDWIGIGLSRRDALHTLQLMTELVETTRLPEEEQAESERKTEMSAKKLGREGMLTRSLIPAMSKVGEACRRKQAQVRCLVTLVAVERYRVKNGKWPEQLEALTPGFLSELPTDPYDGKRVRMARRADGIVVYSVGMDKRDDGGKLNRQQPNAPGTDLGYQLWEIKSRRQPARERPPEVPERPEP